MLSHTCALVYHSWVAQHFQDSTCSEHVAHLEGVDGKYSAAHISVATGALLISTDLLLLKHKDLKALIEYH